MSRIIKTINEFVDEMGVEILEQQKLFSLKHYEHQLKVSCFKDEVIYESSTERGLVIDLIRNSYYEFPQNPKSFYNSYSKSNHPLMLTLYTEEQLSEMKLFKLVGYDIGFALKLKDGLYQEIVAVHNNENSIKSVGSELMLSAISKGGCCLDHYDGFLSNFYKNLGFVEVDRDSFNPIYDVGDKFKNRYGELDVIYRVHKNCL